MKRPHFLVLILALAACERAATDPSIREDVTATSGRSHTLQTLLGDALLVAQRQQGNEAVAALLSQWETRQADVRAAYATGDRAAAQLKLEALRAEEIRIVLKVLGPEIVSRVIDESAANLANATSRMHEPARTGALQGAQASAQEIQSLLHRANTLRAREPERALALAAQAAEQIAAIDDMTTGSRRVRGIETLFPEAALKLSGPELAKHSQLRRTAALALGNDSRAEANAKLAAVRAEEIRLVIAVLGNESATQLLREADAAIRDSRIRLDHIKNKGQDVLRMQRMLKTATDFYNHALAAEKAGDYATALDHGSHAAGLLNSLQQLIAR